MARVEDTDRIISKRKAITAFFPYAVWRGRCGDCGVVETFLGVAKASNPTQKIIDWDGIMWKAVRPFVDTLFDRATPDSLDRVLTLVSPYVSLESWSLNRTMVTRWASATLAIPYSEEASQVVVAVLL